MVGATPWRLLLRDRVGSVYGQATVSRPKLLPWKRDQYGKGCRIEQNPKHRFPRLTTIHQRTLCNDR
jgi:hypothetical protein